MSDFALVHLDAQSSAFARYVRGWGVEEVLEFMRQYGEVKVMFERHNDRVYSFRSASGARSRFRFTSDRRLVIVGDNTSYIPNVYDEDEH